MIIVLAGTIEGREMCSLLQEADRPFLASVTSPWGRELLEQQGVVNIIQGNLSKEDLRDLIIKTGADMVIDATHPFAAVISRDAINASRQRGIQYLRLERQAAVIPVHPLVIRITDLEQMEDYLRDGQTVFSTLGSKHLAALMPILARKGAELVARVLPSSIVVKHCEDLGLKPDQIVALQGPFSLNLNLELLRYYGAELLISKESGAAGGLEAKVGAALQLGIPIVIWSRPELNYPKCFNSSRAVLDYIKKQARDVR